MKRFLLYPCLMSLLCANPLLAISGGLETSIPVELDNSLVTVDIPLQKNGYSIGIESAMLRPYNNNLGYGYTLQPVAGSITPFDIAFNSYYIYVAEVSPDYDFNLRLNLDLLLGYSGNKIRLTYDHLFDRNANDKVTNWAGSTIVGQVRQKLDSATLISEQHMLLGKRWEASFAGGVGFSHLGQKQYSHSSSQFPTQQSTETVSTLTNTLQFNGVGPLIGLGSAFHVTPSFSIGADTSSTLLIGNSSLDFVTNETFTFYSGLTVITSSTTHKAFDKESIYSMVPQWDYRLYLNYLYRFSSDNALLVELGWRGTQFFNVRSYEAAPNLITSPPINGASALQTTTSDKIGFAGPYLLLRWDM